MLMQEITITDLTQYNRVKGERQKVCRQGLIDLDNRSLSRMTAAVFTVCALGQAPLSGFSQ